MSWPRKEEGAREETGGSHRWRASLLFHAFRPLVENSENSVARGELGELKSPEENNNQRRTSVRMVGLEERGTNEGRILIEECDGHPACQF